MKASFTKKKVLYSKESTHFFINNIFISNTRLKLAKNQANAKHIVGKGVHTLSFLDQLPFSKLHPFLEIQDVPTFYRPISLSGKQKYSKTVLTALYIISTLKVS